MTATSASPEQAAVIGAPADDDILVVAGAGSGKTYTMTQRIIALIRDGVPPERILGLTFTRKAAGELLERVSAAVIDDGADIADDIAGNGGVTKADGVAKDGDATGNGGVTKDDGGIRSGADPGRDDDRAFLKPTVHTYDAFFQTIVRQYGLLVGFDQNTQPLSEAGALQLVTDVLDERMPELTATGRDLGAFPTLAKRVLALSNAIGTAMIGEHCTDIAEAIARIRAWDTAFVARVRAAVGDEPVPEQASALKAPKWKKSYSDAVWQAKLDEFSVKMHSQCLYTCGTLIDTAETRDILLDLVEAYTVRKRRLNLAEFGDFTIAAYQLVTRFPSIGRRYRQRFSHVLLDEYQDTSTTQAALLAALFHPDTGGDRRSAVNAVGDPFQSIYAWRGASPGAFRMFRQDFHMGPDAPTYRLSVTRRNSRIVLDAANILTQPLRRPPRRPGSSTMREVDVPALGNLPEATTGTIGVLGYDTLGQQIDGVVRFCREATARHTVMGGGADGKAGHRGTAAVLFRSKALMPDYQQALEHAGLSTFVVGYSALLERPEIRDLLALMHAVADHTDSSSLMRLLATPRFNLSADDLTALSALADADNLEARFRVLAEAGLADADAPRGRWADIVREHRNEVANTVFLADVLQRDDLGPVLERAGGFSPTARHDILRAGGMLRAVQAVAGRPLPDVIRTTAQALDLDIDTVVAQGLRSSDTAISPTVAHMPVDAVIDLVDAYADELSDDHTPTLRGFIAWVDALASIEDETAAMHDEQADVELMTIHQSKGLEWDAVAVVGMMEGSFPSNQGDYLHIETDEDHPGGRVDGTWRAPEYRERARTWLSDPTAVPVPVRADADILPRFPHDAPAGENPIRALDRLEDVEQIDDEVFGSLRRTGDDADGADRDGWYLTQAEEYGRRLHADERRLAYVALTRARHDVLLSYCRHNDPGRDPSHVEENSRTAKPSNFWQEIHDAMHARADAVHTPDNLDMPAPSSSPSSPSFPSSPLPPLPDGFFAGDHAREYENAVVGQAWMTPIPPADDGPALPWPATLSDWTGRALAGGAAAARDMMTRLPQDPGELECFAAAFPDDGLFARARVLLDDADLTGNLRAGASTDEAVKAKAQRIMAGRRQSVTSLQALAGALGEREERAHWRGIVRPIPNVASPAASMGTVFHDWAERFIMADAGVTVPDDGAPAVPTRRAMLEELTDHERRPSGDSAQRELLVWQRRLAGSRWAGRSPVWAERQIVVSVPELDGVIVNGKLDAVFRGGLNPDDPTKRYTVVDWKTGRRPDRPDDISRRLIQLDLYRLLLAAVEGVPLAAIDATLYYLSEADERRRELHAEPKDLRRILDTLAHGIPMQSDDE